MRGGGQARIHLPRSSVLYVVAAYIVVVAWGDEYPRTSPPPRNLGTVYVQKRGGLQGYVSVFLTLPSLFLCIALPLVVTACYCHVRLT